MGNDVSELTVTDAGGWRAWLGDHHRDPTGMWLVPAKKGTTEPTSLMYDQALDEALCIQRRLVALRTLEFLTLASGRRSSVQDRPAPCPQPTRT
jgi:hypothetical protein